MAACFFGMDCFYYGRSKSLYYLLWVRMGIFKGRRLSLGVVVGQACI